MIFLELAALAMNISLRERGRDGRADVAGNARERGIHKFARLSL